MAVEKEKKSTCSGLERTDKHPFFSLIENNFLMNFVVQFLHFWFLNVKGFGWFCPLIVSEL